MTSYAMLASMMTKSGVLAFHCERRFSRSAAHSQSVFYRASSSSSSTMSSSSPSSMEQSKTTKQPSQRKVPITLIGGFLGSGKTTTLKHLLENRQGIKVGVIVNDVASVNIDAKLISSPDNTVVSSVQDPPSLSPSSLLADGVIELQNGCACCSLADELLTTIDTLIESRRSKNNRKPKQHKQGRDDDNDDFDAIVVELSGVADPMAIKANWDAAQLQGLGVTQKAKMSNIVTLVDASTFGSDWMSWDMAGQRPDWIDPSDECGSEQRKVAELLAEQVEAADILLMNKADLASKEQLEVALALTRTINGDAKMEVVEYGKVSPQMILPLSDSIAELSPSATAATTCSDPNCISHNKHSTSSISTTHDEVGTECDHGIDSHSHTHEHEKHGRHHDGDHHNHHHHATDTNNLGITSFVYRADRPFDTRKLLKIIQTWPVPIKDELDLDPYALQNNEGSSDGINKIQFQEDAYLGVLRSKGFCWLAPTKWEGLTSDSWRHDTAMYWSHAGKHFGIKAAGRVRVLQPSVSISMLVVCSDSILPIFLTLHHCLLHFMQ
jgi:G3E family GTPase